MDRDRNWRTGFKYIGLRRVPFLDLTCINDHQPVAAFHISIKMD